MRYTRTAWAVSAGIALTTLMAGCAPGGNSPANATEPSQASAVSTNVGTDPITLKVISTPESGGLVKEAIPDFEKKYTNIKVDYSESAYDDYNTNLNLDLSSDTSPDIALLNMVGNTVKDKLVLNLDDYANLYGWSDVYAGTQLAQWSVGPDGTTLGEGSLYAVPAGYSLVGLFYNKAQLAQLGLQPPKTIADLETAMDKAKAAGLLPFQLSNSEGHSHLVAQMTAQAIDGAANFDKWVFGQTGSTIDTQGMNDALNMLVDWNNKGYLPAGLNGTALQASVDAFTKDQGVFFADGNWDAGAIAGVMGDNVGFVPWPGQTMTGIGTSVAYAISANSSHKDAAAAFLNFLNSPEAGVYQFDAGFIPVNSANISATGVQSEIVAAYEEVRQDNGYVGFMVNSTSTMADTWRAASQELLAGKNTAEGVIQALQDDWTKTHV